MPFVLYNTLSRAKEELKPLSPPAVGLYTCGPTVYNHLHVGNWRTYVFEDVLRRSLTLHGFDVRHVMNVTDVGHLTSQADEGEDKVQMQAAREGKTAWDVAAFYTKSFIDDSKLLNLLPPTILCKATDHIQEQIELIGRLEAKGMTYVIGDGVYYDTSRFPGYGRLMGPNYQKGLKAGKRVEVNPEKRHPADFALWKFSPKGKKRQMEWDSPWGKGFPGWHIECSAMSMKYLGETFDIHCGGVDHIPIHHTNEIAQSEGVTGRPFVNVWVHGEFLQKDQSKMAKSSGGFIRIQDLQEKGSDPLDFRALCYTAHYRKQLDFTWEALDAAKTARWRLIDRARQLARETTMAGWTKGTVGYQRRFQAALANDLDVPGAMAVVWDALKPGALSPGSQLKMLKEAEETLALGLFEDEGRELPKDLQELIERREAARKARDFAGADSLRRQLLDKGVLIEDTPSGVRWKRR